VLSVVAKDKVVHIVNLRIVAAMAEGVLSPEEAAAVSAVVEAQRRAIETEQLEARLSTIEDQVKSNEQIN
jgi:hypothetical protein